MFADPNSFVVTLFVLCFGHFLADFSLQNDYMARTKNHTLIESDATWLPVMIAHCMIHAGVVFVITGRFWMAYVMLLTHFLIDVSKCAGYLGYGARGFMVDQGLHLLVIVLLTWGYCAL